jgi:hypothetical protein
MSKAVHPRAFIPPFLLILLTLLSPGILAGASVLPKFGFSIAPDADMVEIARIANSCGLADAVIILPPAFVTLGDGEAQRQTNAVQEQILKLFPEGSQFYLRLKIEGGRTLQTGAEQEKNITARVADVISRLPLDSSAVRGLLVEIESSRQAVELLNFVLADVAIKSKAKNPKLQLVLSFPPGFIEESGNLVRRLASYYDALETTFTPQWRGNLAWIAEQALNKPVFMRLAPDAASGAEQSATAFLDAAMNTAGMSVEVLWTEQPAAPVLSRLCEVTNTLSRFLPSDVVTVSPNLSPFTLTVDGAASAEYRIFTLPRTKNAGIMLKLDAEGGQKTARLRGPAGGQFEIQWYDALTGRLLKPEEVKKDSAGISQACSCGSGFAIIVIRDVEPSQKQLYSEIEVTARPDLTVEEIIARWQQYKESQRQILNNYVAGCLMGLHFQSAGLGSGFDVSMRFQQFWNREGLTEWVQTDLYVNGVKVKSGWEFPLPQLEPQKVMTPPLELKLTEKYTYRLQGTDRIGGEFCYVIGVEPKEQDEILYSGRIWIEGTRFRQVKMELRQKGTDSNSIANLETQNFALIPDGAGNEINLIKTIYAQQTLNAAGRNFIVERTYDFTDYTINGSDFDTALAAARLSNSTIYRDTDAGLQVLRKEGNQRVLVPRKSSVRSLVAGTMYDGSFNFPIPLLGLGLADFNYRKTGAQLNLLFAGPFLAANLSKQWKGRYRLGLDLALSALPGSNRLYVGNTENKAESLWVFEESVGVRASYQVSDDLSLTGMLYLPYNFYRASGDADKNFVLPKNGVTLLPGFDLKYAHSGYILNVGASQGWRAGWSDFGLATPSQEPPRKTYDTYYAEFKKNFFYRKFMKTGFELNYYGGDRLDRFTRYKPSFISYPRIKGIPSGTDSFDNVGIASVSHGINIFDVIRVEGYYNHAWGRNKTESNHFRAYDGLELDFGTAGPWGTFLQGMVTYAIKGNLDRYNSRWGVYLLIFKNLR